MALDLNLIKAQVERYADIIETTRKDFTFLSGRSLPSGKMTFKVKFKEGVRAEDLPHLTNIEEMEALITVRGRQPLCLNCGILGHISKACSSRFCANCKMQMVKGHACVEGGGIISYANAVKLVEKPQLDPDDWGPRGVGESRDVIFVKPTESDKKLLEQKITDLERQIDMVQDPSDQVPLRLDRKRRALHNIVEDSVEAGDSYSPPPPSEAGGDEGRSEHQDMDAESGTSLVGSGSHEFNVLEEVGALPATPKPKAAKNHKTYGRLGNSVKLSLKAQKEYDKLMETREFTFSD